MESSYHQCLMQRPAASLASLEASGSGSLGGRLPASASPAARAVPPQCRLSPKMAATESTFGFSWTSKMPPLPPLVMSWRAQSLSACFTSVFGSLWLALASSTRISRRSHCRKMEVNRLIFSTTSRACLQNCQHQLQWLPAAESWHLEKPLGFLEIRQLVCCHQALPGLALHNISEQAGRLMRKGSDHMAVTCLTANVYSACANQRVGACGQKVASLTWPGWLLVRHVQMSGSPV